MHILLVHVSGTLNQALIAEDLYNRKLNTEATRSSKSFNKHTNSSLSHYAVLLLIRHAVNPACVAVVFTSTF